jgi:GxxExxY protein
VSTFAPIPKEVEAIGREVFKAALKVHQELGPGLLESTYRACVMYELAKKGISSRAEVAIPVIYEEMHLEIGYRVDLLVDDCVIVEFKCVDGIHPRHQAQIITYLKLSGRRLGFLINFHEPLLKDGFRRFVV